MIDDELKQKIIATLGNHYSGSIIDRLNEKEIYNAKGSSYSPSSIKNIVNGERESEVVENEILDLLAERISALKRKEAKKNKLLKQ